MKAGVLRLKVRWLGHRSWGRWGWAGRRRYRGRAEREGHSGLWEWHEPSLGDE